MIENNCILNLLKLILLLQNNSYSNINNNFSCKKNYLSSSFNSICYNTRVVTFYNKNGSLFTASYGENVSPYFRICSIENSCIKLLILNYDGTSYFSTKEYITININCICAVKCITDISLNYL